jgi:hypothetical protein
MRVPLARAVAHVDYFAMQLTVVGRRWFLVRKYLGVGFADPATPTGSEAWTDVSQVRGVSLPVTVRSLINLHTPVTPDALALQANRTPKMLG